MLIIGLAFIMCAYIAAPVFGGGQGGAAASAAVNPNMNLSGLPIVKNTETYSIAMRMVALSRNTMPEKESVIKAERDTNIKVNWMEIAVAGWEERLNIMFASGDLPDAIIQSTNVMMNLSQLKDVTDIVEVYSPVLAKFYKERPDIKSLMTAPDGRMYSLPAGSEIPWTKTPDGLLINKTWLDAMKLPVPVTTDDFYNVLKVFRDNDMNGNGDRNDEIPFGFCQSDGQATLRSMFGSFGVLDNAEHLQVINNVVTFTPTRPEFLEALRYFNKLFSERLMDMEGFSQQIQQYTAKGRAIPLIYGSFVSFSQMNHVGADSAQHYMPMAPLKGPRGDQLWNKQRGTGINQNGFVITKKCRSPETLIRWYDYINSSLQIILEWDMGPENLGWAYTSDGKWESIMHNVPAGSAWGEIRHTAGVGSAGPQLGAVYDYNAPHIRNISTDTNTLMRVETQAMHEAFWPAAVLPAALEEPQVLQERAIMQTDIDNYIRNFIATAVMNGITDAQWNEHLRNIDRLPVTKYVESYQTMFNRSLR